MQGAKILYEASHPSASVTFGKYELIELIGHGGMAEVWKAKMVGPAGFNRTVVVKRVLPQLAEDPQFAKMFLTEARLSARLTHPNIIQVFELGEVSGHYFLSMEYVRGRDLIQVLRMMARSRSGPPPIELGTVVMRDVCRALAYAHSLATEDGTPLRIIHRDVTPSNVMVAYDGSGKLFDFGIAKAFGAAEDQQTRAGELKGKFAYMAPEQLIPNHPLDHRIDIFAAGVVLWETLTGSRLFKGQNDVDTLQLVREAKIEPPSARNPKVLPELERICLRALQRNPEERYPDAEQMAIDLDRVAHKLSCGAEDVKALLHTLFPGESTGQVSVTHTTGSNEAAASSWSSAPQIYTSMPAERPKGRRLGLVLSGGVVAVAAVVGWTVVSHRLGPHAEESAHAAPAPVVAAPVAKPAAPAAPETVSIQVHSVPPRAEVFLDDETASRGRTPLTLTLPRSSDVHQLMLKLPGYAPKMIPLRTHVDARLELALIASAAPTVVVQAPPRPQPAPPPRPALSAARPVKRAPEQAPVAARASERPARVNDADGEDVLDPFR